MTGILRGRPCAPGKAKYSAITSPQHIIAGMCLFPINGRPETGVIQCVASTNGDRNSMRPYVICRVISSKCYNSVSQRAWTRMQNIFAQRQIGVLEDSFWSMYAKIICEITHARTRGTDLSDAQASGLPAPATRETTSAGAPAPSNQRAASR